MSIKKYVVDDSSLILAKNHLSYDARIGLHFSGRIPALEFKKQFDNIKYVSTKLTSIDILANTTSNSHMVNLDKNFIMMNSKDAQVRMFMGASTFGPCPAYTFDSVGYSLNIFFRGSEKSVEYGVDLAVEKLGFPAYVDLPTNSLLDRFCGLDPLEETNNVGWRLTKNVIKKHGIDQGAELKKIHYTIVKFPFNLLIRECKGKVLDSNFNILGDDYGKPFRREYRVTD